MEICCPVHPFDDLRAVETEEYEYYLQHLLGCRKCKFQVIVRIKKS